MEQKLEAVASGLVSWSGSKFDDLGKKIVVAEKALLELQQQPVTPSSCEQCLELEKMLDDLHGKHEAYWYMRSRVAEVKTVTETQSIFTIKLHRERVVTPSRAW